VLIDAISGRCRAACEVLGHVKEPGEIAVGSIAASAVHRTHRGRGSAASQSRRSRALGCANFGCIARRTSLLIEMLRVARPQPEQRDDRGDVGLIVFVRRSDRVAGDRFDAGVRPQDVLDLTDHAISALDRRTVRQTDGHEKRP
jgi:hypothetical protein